MPMYTGRTSVYKVPTRHGRQIKLLDFCLRMKTWFTACCGEERNVLDEIKDLAEGLGEPDRAPGDYLDELRTNGFVVVDNVLTSDALERIREATYLEIEKQDPAPAEFDDRFGMPHSITWSPDVCRAVTHPVVLRIIREYLSTEDIHFCHQPAMTILRPTKELLGTFPDSGWHADYPYHPDIYPEDRWQDENIYGVQYNICIDEFRTDNAATQYVPGSHLVKSFPPRGMNEGGTRMGTPPHENVEQMVAPAGAALIYDSRTWHRACVELNESGEDRLAILNAVCPRWVRPMVDKTNGSTVFFESNAESGLDDLTRVELNHLCHSETAPLPDGVPTILEKQPMPRRIKI